MSSTLGLLGGTTLRHGHVSNPVRVLPSGGHLHVSLAVAMLIGAVAGTRIVGAAGTARISQLRHSARRDPKTNDDR
jgi:uncharacterized integral membrane protein